MQNDITVGSSSNWPPIWPGRSNISIINQRSNEEENERPIDNHFSNCTKVNQWRGRLRVGKDFQAQIPNIIHREERNVQAENDKALLVWRPNDKISDDEIQHYLSVARDRYKYSGEQALGFLYWHKHNVTRAIQDLENFLPHPEEWTTEDENQFERAFHFHGKAFDQIQLMLPAKSMSSLIIYYYSWKKYCKPCVKDRQKRKFREEKEKVDNQAVSSPLPNQNVINQSVNYNQLPQPLPMLDLNNDEDEILILGT